MDTQELNQRAEIVAPNVWGKKRDRVGAQDNSGQLFDNLITKFDLKNDAGLARHFGLTHAAVSKIRNGALTISARLLLTVHEVTSIPVAELRQLIRSETAKAVE